MMENTMRSKLLPFIAAALLLVAGSARAIDQAMPGQVPAGHPAMGASDAQEPDSGIPNAMAAEDRSAFKAAIRLDDFRLLAVQHNDQVKILDSWARQSLSAIRNLQKIDGEDPLYTALDMAFRPEAWSDRDIIYVQAIPIRQQLAQLVRDDPAEQQRIVTHATISPRFFMRPDVQKRLQEIASNVPLSGAVNKVLIAGYSFLRLQDSLLMITPVKSEDPWLYPLRLAGNVPEYVEQIQAAGGDPQAVPGFTAAQSRKVCAPFIDLIHGWRDGDAAMANGAIAVLTTDYPNLSPAQYRTPFMRQVELIYNRSFNGTIVAFVYFFAFALFTVGAMAQQPRTRLAGLVFFTVAVLCHVLAMSVRWYLAGRIPIQNQFESVLGAALIGCVVGLVAESIKRNGLFGMAFSFVGFLAMTCCFVFPFVIGQSIGENIGKVAGILNNTAWLYIHVNTVIASYSLIAAAAVLGGAYLVAKTWHWVNPLVDDPRAHLAVGTPGDPSSALAYASTTPPPSIPAGAAAASALIAQKRMLTLERIDAATIILLQMAFWVLGTGIVFGAIWADVSWGRPWGWDPKETFALVTWIVYLVIIHVRFITPKNRATVTAVLAVVGLLIMLFNWIGVNFFLAGLHSYA